MIRNAFIRSVPSNHWRSITPSQSSTAPLCAKCNLQNGADGISDIEGKVARVATREFGNERVSNQIRFYRLHRGFSLELRQRRTFRNFVADRKTVDTFKYRHVPRA